MSERTFPHKARVVIIGAGQAGAQAAISLRQGGHEGPIAILGEEAHPPYQRPPLSKKYLAGEWGADRLFIRPMEAWAQDGVEVAANVTAQAIDRENQRVLAADGRSWSYDVLVLATGSRARRLNIPGADSPNAFYLRGLDDVDAIRVAAQPGRHVAILGAGYIGLEAAAMLRQLGLDVSVIEQAPRALARVASPALSAFFEREHRAQGVAFRFGDSLQAIEDPGDAKGIRLRLASGEAIAADFIILGIGILPNQELARAAGLACRDGVLVDAQGCSSDPRIFAIGDCARRPLPDGSGDIRLESVHNALEQARLAAAAILGAPAPPIEAPWFWSDQYDLKLQMVGLSANATSFITRGDPAQRRFALYYFHDDRLIACDAVNSPPDFMAAKAMVLAGACPDPVRLADPAIPIKEFMPRKN